MKKQINKGFIVFIVFVAIVGCSILINVLSTQSVSSNYIAETATNPSPTPMPKATPTPSPKNSNTTSKHHTEKVTCSNCNGTGKVKYYYGSSALEAALNGHNDYEYGPCSNCDGKGYKYFTVSGSSKSSNTVICPSCGKSVSKLITRKDLSGANKKWCSKCWSEYDEILGN